MAPVGLSTLKPNSCALEFVMGTDGQPLLPTHYVVSSRGCVTGQVHSPPSPSALPQHCGPQAFQEVTTEKKGKAQVFFCGSPALAKVLKGHCEHFSFKIFQENFCPHLSKLCPDPHRQPA